MEQTQIVFKDGKHINVEGRAEGIAHQVNSRFVLKHLGPFYKVTVVCRYFKKGEHETYEEYINCTEVKSIGHIKDAE